MFVIMKIVQPNLDLIKVQKVFKPKLKNFGDQNNLQFNVPYLPWFVSHPESRQTEDVNMYCHLAGQVVIFTRFGEMPFPVNRQRWN